MRGFFPPGFYSLFRGSDRRSEAPPPGGIGAGFLQDKSRTDTELEDVCCHSAEFVSWKSSFKKVLNSRSLSLQLSVSHTGFAIFCRLPWAWHEYPKYVSGNQNVFFWCLILWETTFFPFDPKRVLKAEVCCDKMFPVRSDGPSWVCLNQTGDVCLSVVWNHQHISTSSQWYHSRCFPSAVESNAPAMYKTESNKDVFCFTERSRSP